MITDSRVTSKTSTAKGHLARIYPDAYAMRPCSKGRSRMAYVGKTENDPPKLVASKPR